MNSKLQQLIHDLELISSTEVNAASLIHDFQKRVWQSDIQISSGRDHLIREVLDELAYDLHFIDPEKSMAWKDEILAALRKLFVIAAADDAQIVCMVEDLDRPALERARQRKHRFVGGRDGIKDDG
jgi:hypothetical protein